MSLTDPPTSRNATLYFAYGSNMHISQMSTRCPDSTLFGIGRLPSYKWQVSTRGGGNIVPARPEDSVHGLVFAVSETDVQKLRGFEGVEKGFFVEERRGVHMEGVDGDREQLGTREALVYMSYTYSEPGTIREEYSARMRLAVADARRAGVSEEYLGALDAVINGETKST